MRVGKLIVVWSILTAASAAQAVNGLVIEAEVHGSVPGVTRDDVQGPAASGSLLATVNMPEASDLEGSGPAFGRSGQNEGGVAAVWAELKAVNNGDAHLESRTSWTKTVTNNSTQLVSFVYEFNIAGPTLVLFDPSGTAAVPAEAWYEITVKLGAATIFNSRAVLRGGRFSYNLKETGTDLGGVFFGTPGTTPFGYSFSPFHGTIPLGNYLPGQSVTIAATLDVYASAVNASNGAEANIGDPLDLSGDPGLFNVITIGEPTAVTASTWSAVKELYRGQ